MPTFVTYYVKPPPEELELLKETYRETHRRFYDNDCDPDEIISILFASVKKYHPKCRCCLLTDKESQFELDPSIEVIRYPRKTFKLDLEVLRALIYYLQTSKKEENTIFLEWDQIVQGDVSKMFICKADLYLAYRRIPPAPFDDAIIAIGSGHFSDVADFFKMVIKEYRQIKSTKLRYWLGKSIIFSSLFFDRLVKMAGSKKRVAAFKWKDVVISILNGRKYSKKLLKHETQEYQKEALIVHFSNKRCRHMKEYWEKFVKDK